jgi:hypothetical protein
MSLPVHDRRPARPWRGALLQACDFCAKPLPASFAVRRFGMALA